MKLGVLNFNFKYRKKVSLTTSKIMHKGKSCFSNTVDCYEVHEPSTLLLFFCSVCELD